MKNLIRKISRIAGILSLVSIIGCTTIPIKKQKFYNQLGIPKEFINYRSRGKIVSEGMGMLKGYLVYEKDYDIDKDGTMDVSELYHPDNKDKEPIFYGFDIDDNGYFDENEIFVDDEQDGINGNEVLYSEINKKISAQKKLI